MTATKYPTASCALCGSTVRGKGYFCSYHCDELEMTQRRGDGRERAEQGTTLKRKLAPEVTP